MTAIDDTLADLSKVNCNPQTLRGRKMYRCPQCSHMRVKKNQKCLSVLADNDGFRFKCHHCNWCGGHFYEAATSWASGGGIFRSKKNKSRDSREVRRLYGPS
jgi:hypothetical protein